MADRGNPDTATPDAEQRTTKWALSDHREHSHWLPIGDIDSDDGFSIPFGREHIDVEAAPQREPVEPQCGLGISDPFEALALLFFVLAAAWFVGLMGFAVYLMVTGGWTS